MQSKQTRCASIAARLHGGELLFQKFANGSEHKGLSVFTGKFPSSAAGLHLVYRMVECFHAITIDAKRLHFRCEQYCIILPSRNKSFSRNPFEFLHIRESLVSRSSILETRDSILETQSSNVSSIEARGSSLEVRVSSVNLLLSGTVASKIEKIGQFFQIAIHFHPCHP